MKVYVVQECYAYEGSTVKEVFKNLDKSIEFVKQKYPEFPKMETFEAEDDIGLEVKTIRFEKSSDENYFRFVDIEEWEVKG